jgi:protein Mpv17
MKSRNFKLCFYSTGYLERQPLKEINREFSNKWLTIYTADWIVWPVVQAINFYYLQPRHRVIFINGVTSLYNIFLSFVKHSHHSPEDVKTVKK